MSWSNHHTWVAGLLIIVLTNAVALAGVVWNRSGEATAVVTLTERELASPNRYGRYARENSGLSLELEWRAAPEEITANTYAARWAQPHWLNRDKLTALGFNLARLEPPTDYSWRRAKSIQSRKVYIVLEYDGPAWRAVREAVERLHVRASERADRNPGDKELEKAATDARKRWQTEQSGGSRLFAIDADLDPSALRSKYPDQSRYVITTAQVKPHLQHKRDKTWEATGTIVSLEASRIHVDASYRGLFQQLSRLPSRHRYDPARTPRFKATIAWGKRYEPWVLGIELSGEKPDNE